MKTKFFILSLMSCCCLIQFSAVQNESATPTRFVLHKMITELQSCNSLQYTIQSFEKNVVDNTISKGEAFTKINIAPTKIYLKLLNGSEAGTELLYASGENNNKVIVNAGKWLPTIKLNPLNTMITKNQHHSIFSAGFGLMLKVVTKTEATADNQHRFDSVFRLDGETIYNGAKCYVMRIEDKHWNINNYAAKANETVLTVAGKLLVSEYAIMRLNKLKDINDDVSNTTIKVPSAYAYSTVLYIDEKTFFPVYQSLCFSKNEEFERYEFAKLQLNPNFQPNEFSQKFPDYGF